MKKLAVIAVLGLSIIAIGRSQAPAKKAYTGSVYNKVWRQVESDAYSLPQYILSYGSLFDGAVDMITRRAFSTLSDKSDLLPEFNKLAHPNGICFKGTWKITGHSDYTGYFSRGSEAMIIARASVALSKTKRGYDRGFGLAGKLFPTNNPNQSAKLKTANFFVADDLGGTKAPHFTGVAMTNEPPVSTSWQVMRHIRYGLKLKKVFGKADSNPGVRQLYPIAELDERFPNDAITPKWMQIKAWPGQTVNEDDFRDELNIKHYNGTLGFDISVSSEKDANGNIVWNKIGTIEFNDSVVSKSCDKRLHFAHPKWRNNLKHVR